jgi:hypothetical protein
LRERRVRQQTAESEDRVDIEEGEERSRDRKRELTTAQQTR